MWCIPTPSRVISEQKTLNRQVESLPKYFKKQACSAMAKINRRCETMQIFFAMLAQRLQKLERKSRKTNEKFSLWSFKLCKAKKLLAQLLHWQIGIDLLKCFMLAWENCHCKQNGLLNDNTEKVSEGFEAKTTYRSQDLHRL